MPKYKKLKLDDYEDHPAYSAILCYNLYVYNGVKAFAKHCRTMEEKRKCEKDYNQFMDDKLREIEYLLNNEHIEGDDVPRDSTEGNWFF